MASGLRGACVRSRANLGLEQIKRARGVTTCAVKKPSPSESQAKEDQNVTDGGFGELGPIGMTVGGSEVRFAD